MTFKVAQTKLMGFPILYDSDVDRHLNQVISSRSFNNFTLNEIGKAVSGDVEHHSTASETEDGYWWFGRLDYKINGSKVAILFPWAQDFNHPETTLDRSLNVYSDRKIDREVVGDLLERVAYQMTLCCLGKKLGRF